MNLPPAITFHGEGYNNEWYRVVISTMSSLLPKKRTARAAANTTTRKDKKSKLMVEFVFCALQNTCYRNDAQITMYNGGHKRHDDAHGGNGYIHQCIHFQASLCFDVYFDSSVMVSIEFPSKKLEETKTAGSIQRPNIVKTKTTRRLDTTPPFLYLLL